MTELPVRSLRYIWGIPDRSDAYAICPGPPPISATTLVGVTVGMLSGVLVATGVEAAVGVSAAERVGILVSVGIAVQVGNSSGSGRAARMLGYRSFGNRITIPAHAISIMKRKSSQIGLRRRRLAGGTKAFFSSSAKAGSGMLLPLGVGSRLISPPGIVVFRHSGRGRDRKFASGALGPRLGVQTELS